MPEHFIPGNAFSRISITAATTTTEAATTATATAIYCPGSAGQQKTAMKQQQQQQHLLPWLSWSAENRDAAALDCGSSNNNKARAERKTIHTCLNTNNNKPHHTTDNNRNPATHTHTQSQRRDSGKA